ncbi:MAG: S41 family peptidase [bacterium]
MKLLICLLTYIISLFSLNYTTYCQNPYTSIKKFEFILQTIVKNHTDVHDYETLINHAIKGMLNDIDSTSVYYTPEEMKSINENSPDEVVGIGIQFDIVNDTMIVISPNSSGPAEKAGLISGDMIIAIDGRNIIGLDNNAIPKMLRGPLGSIVKISIKRPGTLGLLDFEIKREKIPSNSIDASFIIDKTSIGVIRINRFSSTTLDEVKNVLDTLSKNGMTKLIIDLRNNPGGYLNSVYFVSSLFLNKGDTICYTKGRNESFDDVYICQENGKYNTIPLTIIANQNSAAGSEIMAGAIQDLDRGLIAGNITYGRGSIDRIYEVGDGSRIKLTISKFYLRSGRCIHRSNKEKKDYAQFRDKIQQRLFLNVEKDGESITKSLNPESLPLVFKTVNGRNVYGGGGITPDFIINENNNSDFLKTLFSKKLIYSFAYSFYFQHRNELEKIIKNDPSGFMNNYNFTVFDIKDLSNFFQSKINGFDKNQFENDKNNILLLIKLEIIRFYFGETKYNIYKLSTESQILKIISLFSEAERIGVRYLK